MKLSAVAQNLATLGLGPIEIAAALDVDIEQILALKLARQELVLEEADIPTMAGRISFRVYQEIMSTLNTGSHSQKQAIMRLVLSFMMRGAQLQTPHELEEVKEQFRSLIETQDSKKVIVDDALAELIWDQSKDGEAVADEPDPLHGNPNYPE
jgi:hypothetical protein